MMTPDQTVAGMTGWLPDDARRASLLGRMDFGAGPTPVRIAGETVFDLSGEAPTIADLLNRFPDVLPAGREVGTLDALGLANGPAGAAVRLLAPVDLQCIKACGVTFAVSALERVIEERARGEAEAAQAIRAALAERVGADLRQVRPGSDAAQRLKAVLIADGLWSQYLEVAIGPDAEVFTKGPALSAVGSGARIGVRSDSQWNNPEPEIALVCDARGQARGATLGNDVNLRDFEGRSALLLGKAKDNNASCALGPFIRLFDRFFSLNDVRGADVRLRVDGADGFVLNGVSNMREISRDPLELVRQTIGAHHQYPDGFVLFLGTLFAPTEDRDAPGRGFTHKVGDRVRVSNPQLGCLDNEVVHCEAAPPWTFGIGALMRNLAQRGLLGDAA